MSNQRAEEKALANSTFSAITPELLADANIGVGPDGSVGWVGMANIRPFTSHVAGLGGASSAAGEAGTTSQVAAADSTGSAPATLSIDCPIPRYHALVPIKYGYLVKQGHSFRTWKRRLCAVYGKYLYYYADEEDREPRGVLLLDNCVVRDELAVAKERKSLCFSVTVNKSWNVVTRQAFADRTYYFCLNSLLDMNDWMAHISAQATNLPRHAGEPLF